MFLCLSVPCPLGVSLGVVDVLVDCVFLVDALSVEETVFTAFWLEQVAELAVSASCCAVRLLTNDSNNNNNNNNNNLN